jgi:hypothetical protein
MPDLPVPGRRGTPVELTGKELIAARYNRQRQLRKMTKATLVTMYKSGVTAPDGQKVYGIGGAHPIDQWSKDDIIASIVHIEYPDN